MGSLRKTAAAGFVWLTATMTVLAGTPLVLCHCADGSIRLPGLELSAVPPCCMQKRTHPVAHKPACPHCRPASRSSGPKWRAPCCHQSAVQPVVGTDDGAKTKVAMPSSSSAFVEPASLTPVAFDASNPAGVPHCQPPPTDRVITLQHLLI